VHVEVFMNMFINITSFHRITSTIMINYTSGLPQKQRFYNITVVCMCDCRVTMGCSGWSCCCCGGCCYRGPHVR